MNKEYVYNNGKITIIDELGKKKNEEYYENIDEVLVLENVIETMENEIKKLEEECKKNEKNKTNKLFCLVPILGSGIISLIAPLLIMPTLTNESITSLINDPFYSNYILTLTSIIFPIGITIGTTLSIFEYLEYQKEIKKNAGIVSKLDYLKKEIIIKREQLKVLQNNKFIENKKNETRIVKVNDINDLKKLKDEMDQYYELGYNIDKYYKYYDKGNLDDNLPKYVDVNYAKEYIKQKKLVKKK